MPVDTGKMRYRVQLQAPTVTRSTGGHVVKTYTTIGTVWASIRYLRGREYYAAQQTQAETTAEITIWHYHKILPTWRVVHGAQNFEIEAIVPDQVKNIDVLRCKAVV